MSSTKEKTCHICKEPESLPTKPLVACVTCRGKWHQFCHNPKILDVKSEWRCARCTKKRNANMDPPAKLLTAVSICEFPSCRTPIFQGSSSGLCKLHGIQAQYHNANRQKSDNTSRTVPTSKPFNKAKLHRVNNPDDDVKAILKEDKKRKREAFTTKKSAGYYTTEASTSEPRNPASNLDSNQTPEERQYLINLAAQNQKNAANAHSKSAPKVTDHSNPDSSGTNLNLAQKSPRHEEPPDSLEYEPPNVNSTAQLVAKTRSANLISPLLGPIKIAKLAIVDIDEDASPGTQIVQEFRATVEKPQPSPAVAGHSFFNRLNSFRPQDPQEQELVDIAIQKELERSDEAMREDDAMRNALHFSPELEAVAAEDIPLPSNERDVIPASPGFTSISSSPNPNDDILLNAVQRDFAGSPLVESIESIRKLRAAKYNSSTLDKFLVEQSRSTTRLQPTPEELVKTQIWGHIDPRVKWPKQHCDDWLEEKRQEVKERGGRKANFGKLLTSQVLKERSEKGWGLHQNKEVSIDDEKLAEGAKALEELFGIKDIDELEPEVRNGRLGMIEKSIDENGRRKRKPKMYPIGYDG